MFTDFFGPVNILLSTIGLLLIYRFVLRQWNFFSKNNVKFVRGLPIIGSHYKCILGPMTLFESFDYIYKQYPNERFIGLYEMGGSPSYLIRDPELVKQVAIKDFDHFVNHANRITPDTDPLFSRALFMMQDQRWKDMRSTLSPAFTGKKMRAMNALMVEVSNIFCNEIKKELGGQSKIFSMKDIFGRVATDIIATTAFGMNINSMKERNNQFYQTGFKIISFGLKTFLFQMCPKLMKWLKMELISQETVDYFRNLVLENMKYRQEHNIVRPDMINILLEVKKGMLANEPDEEEENAEFATVNEGSISNTKYRDWDDDDLIAQSVLFFLAGFSSISNTMCLFMYEIAMHPDIQQRLYEEIDEVKGKLEGASIDYETIKKMKYLDMVFSELLRLRIGFASDRAVSKPYTLENYDGSKVQLNVGDAIWIPSYSLHLDPKYYPDPEKFDPERFNDENKSNITSGTFIPFGIGPRSCIANRFAILECKLLIFHLLSEFRFEKCEKTMVPIKFCKTIPEPKDGVWLRLHSRK